MRTSIGSWTACPSGRAGDRLGRDCILSGSCPRGSVLAVLRSNSGRAHEAQFLEDILWWGNVADIGKR